MSDLSPEQEIARAVVSYLHGPEIADRVVRDDRVTAYLVGAHLAPTLDELSGHVAALVEKWRVVFGRYN